MSTPVVSFCMSFCVASINALRPSCGWRPCRCWMATCKLARAPSRGPSGSMPGDLVSCQAHTKSPMGPDAHKTVVGSAGPGPPDELFKVSEKDGRVVGGFPSAGRPRDERGIKGIFHVLITLVSRRKLRWRGRLPLSGTFRAARDATTATPDLTLVARALHLHQPFCE